MSVYTFVGRPHADLDDALRSFESFLGHSAAPVERLGVSLNSDSAGALLDCVGGGGLGPLSVFGWREFRLGEFADAPELGRLGGCSISGGGWQVEVGEQVALPPQDWGETPAPDSTLRLTHTVETTARDPWPEPSGEVLQKYKEVVAACVADPERCEFRTNTSYESGRARHSYLCLNVAKTEHSAVLVKLLEGFRVDSFVGSFQFDGDEALLRRLEGGGRYHLAGYPPPLSTLNYYGTAFSVEPQLWRRVLPNSDLADAERVARRAWNRRTEIAWLVLSRDYLAWKLSEGAASPRAWGNYCQLSLRGGALQVSVAAEQYLVSAPPVRAIMKPLKDTARELGGALKRI